MPRIVRTLKFGVALAHEGHSQIWELECQLQVVSGDVMDAAALGRAMQGHNAVINAAGTAASRDTRPFQDLFKGEHTCTAESDASVLP